MIKENYVFRENHTLASDPVEIYFECISSCNITDGTCVSKCVEKLREEDN